MTDVTELSSPRPAGDASSPGLVLSLFPGIGLLDRGFEQAGFIVTRGPDLIWGGDIRAFHPPAGYFDGVIGGPPCQDFSVARRSLPPTGNGLAMLAEYRRVVEEAQPAWWLMENVPAVPDMRIDGYNWQRLDLRANEFGLMQQRNRHIQFGSRSGDVLVVERHSPIAASARAVTASDRTIPWEQMIAEQGLPSDFDIPSFTRAALRRAIGNGVPVPMAAALARAVLARVPEHSVRLCGCGCGRPVSGNATYAGSGCRMRMHRRRRDAGVTAGKGEVPDGDGLSEANCHSPRGDVARQVTDCHHPECGAGGHVTARQAQPGQAGPFVQMSLIDVAGSPVGDGG